MTHIHGEDQDRLKGAIEQEEKDQQGNTSMQGQLGHRDQDPMLKAADTDFPEPGESPEHTGEPEDCRPTCPTPKTGLARGPQSQSEHRRSTLPVD